MDKYDREAFSFLVTPPENAYKKKPKGGVLLSTKVHTVARAENNDFLMGTKCFPATTSVGKC